MVKKPNAGGFEEKLAKLEEIVGKLEDEDTPIEESLSLFEEGVTISKELSVKLEEVKRKIEVLKKDAEGKLKLSINGAPFSEATLLAPLNANEGTVPLILGGLWNNTVVGNSPTQIKYEQLLIYDEIKPLSFGQELYNAGAGVVVTP